MAFTATATKVFTRTGMDFNSSTYGVIAQADGSYLAGSSQPSSSFPFPTSANWYRSTNNGLSWSFVQTTNGFFSQYFAFPCNVHANVALASSETPSNNGWDLMRSTDGGASWSDVFSCAPAASPNGRFVAIWGAQSYDRDKVIIWGELDGDENNAPALYALSTDAGASFTIQAPWDEGDFDDFADAFGIAADGFWWFAYTKFGGMNRESYLARSENYGATWGTPLRTRRSDGSNWVAGTAITAFDQQNILFAATNGLSPTSSVPGLWWSDDAGDSLTHVPAADVASWPSGSFYSTIREVKRLTRDSCIIAFDQQNGTPGSPWRISLDKGQTFPIVVNLSGGSFPDYVIPFGKICTTRDGKILAMLCESSDYVDFEHCIYRIEIDC